MKTNAKKLESVLNCTCLTNRSDNISLRQSGRSMIEMLGVLAIIGVLSIGGIAGYSKAMTKYKINKTANQIAQLAQNIRTLYASQKNYGTLSIEVIQKAHLAPSEMFSFIEIPSWPNMGIGVANAGIITAQASIWTSSSVWPSSSYWPSSSVWLASSVWPSSSYWPISVWPSSSYYQGLTGTSILKNPFGGNVNVAPSGKMYSGDNKAFAISADTIPQEACVEILTQDWGSGTSSGLIALGGSTVTDKYYGCADRGSTQCVAAGVMSVGDAIAFCSNATNNTLYWKFF